MQIFSELQRNSAYQIFIKIFFIFIINVLSSYTVYAPLMIGYFFICEEFFAGLLFVLLFSLLHDVNVWGLLGVYFFYKLYFIQSVIKTVNPFFLTFMLLGVLYALLLIYLYIKFQTFFVVLYVAFNFAFELLLLKVIKCEVK